MLCAVDFFPRFMIVWMNFVTSCDWWIGSASTSRLTIALRLGISAPLLLRPLRSVLGTRASAAFDGAGVERPAHHVVPDAGEVLHAAPADEHDRVLLQVVADSGDVG